jgi:hypothetical protein
MQCVPVYAGLIKCNLKKNTITRKFNITIFHQMYKTETYDFITLFRTTPHDKLKTKPFDIIDICFVDMLR